MKSIPKSLLIHSVIVREFVSTPSSDMWGEKKTLRETTLNFVRVESSSNLDTSTQNEQVKITATLLFDCCNSRPADFDFSHADCIVFEGKQYKIGSVSKMIEHNKVHHIEVELWQ